jgi:hypothetical protein
MGSHQDDERRAALDAIRTANDRERELVGDSLRERARRAGASWEEIEKAFASPPGPGL